MKITKISLQSFRAFDEQFELNLAGGKSLLLCGENGSGKSSVYLALKRFFEERGDEIARHRNQFSPGRRASHVRIHIKGKDAAGVAHDREVVWDTVAGHPLPVPKGKKAGPVSEALRSTLVDAAHRAGFLDYRAMLRTSLLFGPIPRSNSNQRIHDSIYGDDTTGLEAQLFDLISLVILAGVRVPVPGGGESTIGALIRKVWENRPKARSKAELERAATHTNTFNQAFNAKLPDLKKKLDELLDQFENHQLAVAISPVSLAWDKPTLELKGAELGLEVAFRGKAVSAHHKFLNEARLSAFSTCMFLAGVLLSDYDEANPAYPRFLVLDDALIGLELQNRLPVLRILKSAAFKNYQIFLFTYDRVWFELARAHLREKDGWVHRELLADESTGHLVPRRRSSMDDVEIAKRHLANDDLKAAAVYARSAFEWKLRKVCEKTGVKIPFNRFADKVGAGDLWDGIISTQAECEKMRAAESPAQDFMPAALAASVETMRSTVLNKLSHAGASGLVKSEVADAIATVEAVLKHTFPKASA